MILLGSIYMAVNSAQRHSMGIERKVAAQQDVRPSLELMAMEIRMASFNPNFTTGNWVTPTGSGACTNASPNRLPGDSGSDGYIDYRGDGHQSKLHEQQHSVMHDDRRQSQ